MWPVIGLRSSGPDAGPVVYGYEALLAGQFVLARSQETIRWRMRGMGLESQGLLHLDKSKHLPTIVCPNCMMVWLAPGLEHGDTYECRSCRLSFVVRRPNEEISKPCDELLTRRSASDQEQ